MFSESSPRRRPGSRQFFSCHPDVNRGLGWLCRGSILFFSKEGVAGSTRRGSLVPGHCRGLFSGGNAEIPAFAGMTKKGAGMTV